MVICPQSWNEAAVRRDVIVDEQRGLRFREQLVAARDGDGCGDGGKEMDLVDLLMLANDPSE